MIFLPRSAWAPPSSEPPVPLQARQALVIHHTAGSDDDHTPSIWESLEECLERMKRLQGARPDLFRGRPPDVPYNAVSFFVDHPALPRHVMVEGIGLDVRGAHSERANTPHLGLAFAGTFSELPKGMSQEDLAWELGRAVEYLRCITRRPLPLLAHRELKNTLCPGDALAQAVEKLQARGG